MNYFQQIKWTRDFLKSLHIKPRYLIISGILSLAAALFEGVSLAMLAPLIQGMVTMDYSLPYHQAWLGGATAYLNEVAAFLQLPPFAFLVSVVFLTSLAKIVFRYLSSIQVAYLARIANHNLRKQIFDRYLSFGKIFFDQNNIGYLNQVLTDYTGRVTRPIMEANQLFNAFFSFVIYLVLMFLISWRLTLFVLLVFPVMNYAQQMISRKIRRRSRSMASAINRFSRSTFNVLSSIPLVMAYNREEAEKKHFAMVSNEAADKEYRMARLHDQIRPTHEAIALCTIILLVIVMAALVARGTTTISASFLVYFYLIMNLTNTYGSFQRFRGLIAQAEGPLADIKQVLSDQDKHYIKSGDKEFNGLKQQIEFRRTHFVYADTQAALHDVSFSVTRGTMTAIVGPSGAGKTTIINLLMRYYDCEPGMLFIDGVDIRDYSLPSLRSHLALVSQDTALFNDTLRNNITYGLENVTDEQLIAATKKARLYDFIMTLPKAFESEIGDHGVKLSGGEKQRVSITRALLKGADIIILDEATSALDSKTEKMIQIAINEAIQDKTAIVIAHRLATIKNADRIVVVEKGRIIEQGTLEELLAIKGSFYAYWGEQKFH